MSHDWTGEIGKSESLRRNNSRLDFNTCMKERNIKRSRDTFACFCNETYYCMFVKGTIVTEVEINDVLVKV